MHVYVCVISWWVYKWNLQMENAKKERQIIISSTSTLTGKKAWDYPYFHIQFSVPFWVYFDKVLYWLGNKSSTILYATRKTRCYFFSYALAVVFRMLLISETWFTYNFQLKKVGNFVFAWHRSSIVSIATNDKLFPLENSRNNRYLKWTIYLFFHEKGLNTTK